MSWPQRVCTELAAATASAQVRRCCRQVQLAVLLRLAGQTYRCGAHLVIEAELSAAAAATARAALLAVPPAARPQRITLRPTGNTDRVLQITEPGTGRLATWTGLLETALRADGGLPRFVVSASRCCTVAAWQAAFLAAGTLSRPARGSELSVACPTTATALALTGLARRLPATPGNPGDSENVVPHATVRPPGRRMLPTGPAAELAAVSGDEEITALLTRIGAPATAADWATARRTAHARRTAPMLSGACSQNRQRQHRAATDTIAKLQTALEVLDGLGVTLPQPLTDAAQLRLAHPALSLEQLAQIADPPTTKDTIAGRLRRLLALAGSHTNNSTAPQ
ncbi:hypothetical protein GCM10010411_74840 [Actinomadura fulvescens]|uniref:Cell division protein WhiA n=1 Tax=Actinomadura fulvescens TaxID=46160 RepID=A0ABN3QIB9_9ACTN